MANSTSKNVGLGKFRPDLEISKAFFKGLEVSFSGIFLRLGVSNFFNHRSRSLGFFFVLFGFQKSNFSELRGATYGNERVN